MARPPDRDASASFRGSRRLPRRAVRLAAAAGAASLLLAACGGDDGGGGDSGGPVTLTWANWATAEQTTRPAIEQVIADFEAEHPNIRIKSQAIAFSDIAQQLVLRTQSGNPPDVAQLSGNDTISLAATGALAPLDQFVDDELRSRINPTDLENGTHEGELIAFPWVDSPQGFWYNKKLMAQAGLDPESPPQTIEDLNTALAAIKQKFPESTPLALDTTNRAFGLTSNWAWMKTFGAEPFGDDGAQADSPEYTAYLEWMDSLAKNDYIVTGPLLGEFRPLAAQNEVAFMWDQNLLQGVIQDTNGMTDQEFYDTWGVTTLPAGPTGESYSVDLGHQLVMFGQSEKKEAAWKFIEYLATSENAVLNYTLAEGAALPPLSDPKGEVAEVMDTPVNNAYVENIMPTSTKPPYGQAFSSAYDPVMANLQRVLTSDVSVDEVASATQSQLESALE
ncbi:carbohydrate ABC transporter substrate-binding protein (CUT1 family) [Haloactinopolyspora alba]|uniref:Carbohydrate ABC transporter substrate-binding protein (CUT1 family) n=1 Tax=Haloactinopolyspora alba TaxID=648780 RepID=A0A2P8EG06_9ACTN|nr:sugar ABC transporter substrate-binding protein [Haloactinopolyspora alba]PSL08403.1 carbohydrate ABC transporter substrate-binding protein (CUT1 family) [Haloactinopolyspora alba]